MLVDKNITQFALRGQRSSVGHFALCLFKPFFFLKLHCKMVGAAHIYTLCVKYVCVKIRGGGEGSGRAEGGEVIKLLII